MVGTDEGGDVGGTSPERPVRRPVGQTTTCSSGKKNCGLLACFLSLLAYFLDGVDR